MNCTSKTMVGCLVGIIAICLVVAGAGFLLYRSTGWILGQAISTDPNRVATIASEIADFDLPAGFGDGYAAKVAAYSMVGYTGADNHSHIYLFQLPAKIRLDQAEMRRQANQAARRTDRYSEMKVVGQQVSLICEKEVNLTIAEGTNHDGQPFREISGAFQGKAGQAFLVYSAPVESWDPETVDAFLASLR